MALPMHAEAHVRLTHVRLARPTSSQLSVNQAESGFTSRVNGQWTGRRCEISIRQQPERLRTADKGMHTQLGPHMCAASCLSWLFSCCVCMCRQVAQLIAENAMEHPNAAVPGPAPSTSPP